MALIITDDLWALVEPLIPQQPPSTKGGQPRKSDRRSPGVTRCFLVPGEKERGPAQQRWHPRRPLWRQPMYAHLRRHGGNYENVSWGSIAAFNGLAATRSCACGRSAPESAVIVSLVSW